MSKASETKHVYWIRVELKGSGHSAGSRARHIPADVRRSSSAEDAQMFTDRELMGMIEHGIREARHSLDRRSAGLRSGTE